MECPQDGELTGFVSRTLAADNAARLEAHIAECDDCRQLLFAIASGPPPTEEVDAPARVGRFELLDEIGRGAMGVVYRAHDPELERTVAIKLRRAPSRLDVDGEDRLRREAQALARLQHPHVVVVFEAGRHEDTAYLAMEYVEGPTLDVWLATPRSRDEIRARFVEAGRGIAAAHAVGLVHRDVKPRNIFVSTTGGAKIGDFGLVRAAASTDASGADLTLTMTGALLGTPAYMAPEQLRGAPASEASDQFSFCVTLFEALAGQRPFVGTTIDELLAAMDRPPVMPRMPSDIAAVLRRGLARDSAARFPSMDALLDRLDGRRTRRRQRNVIVAGVTLAALAAGGAAATTLHDEPAEVCQGAERNLVGIWDPARKAEIERAFLATNLPYAKDVWATVAARLDRFAASWTAMHTQACEATRVHGEQPETVLTARMWCLDDRLRDAHALTDALATAAPRTVKRAIDATSKLGDVETCADVRALTERQPPKDVASRARLEPLQSELAKGRTAANLGDFKASEAHLSKALDGARSEAYAPLEAQALVELARTRFSLHGDAKAAEVMLRDAILAAERGRDDALRARSYLVLVFLVGVAQGRFDEGAKLAELGTAITGRLRDDEGIGAQLRANAAQLLMMQGKHAEAEPILEEVRATLTRRMGADHYEVGLVVALLADIARNRGDYARALALATLSYETTSKSYGPRHPETAKSRFAIGAILEDQGDYEAAATHVQGVIDTLEAALGKDHVDLGPALDELGLIRRKQDRFADALALHQRALAVREATLGPDSLEVSISVDNIGLCLGLLDRDEEAIAHHRRAIAIVEKALGEGHPETAASYGYLANTYLDGGRPELAVKEFERALAITEKAVGPDHIDLSFHLSGLGDALTQAGRPAEAIAHLERALRIRGTSEGFDPYLIAQAKFQLAQALWDSKRDRARAHALVVEARPPYEKAGTAHVLDTWLATHRR